MKFELEFNAKMWTYNNLMCKIYEHNGRWVWEISEISTEIKLDNGLAPNEEKAKEFAQNACDQIRW